MWPTKARKMSMVLSVNWTSSVAKSFPRFEIRNLTDIHVYILNLSVRPFSHLIVHFLFVPNRYYIAMNLVCHQKSVIVSFFSLMTPLNRYRLETWLNDTFLNVLQKSIIKVSLKYHWSIMESKLNTIIADALTIIRWHQLIGQPPGINSAQQGQAPCPCWESTLPHMGKHRAHFRA